MLSPLATFLPPTQSLPTPPLPLRFLFKIFMDILSRNYFNLFLGGENIRGNFGTKIEVTLYCYYLRFNA